jgi:hypothetical protein
MTKVLVKSQLVFLDNEKPRLQVFEGGNERGGGFGQ